MRFESKRDVWIVLVLRVVPLVVLVMIAGAWYAKHGDVRGPLIGAALLIFLEIFFLESLLRSTYYVIDGGTLTIRSSFITWRVPIAEIRRISPTRERPVIAGALPRPVAHRVRQ